MNEVIINGKLNITCTKDEYLELEDENFGCCLQCAATAYNCEPDASRYVCDECGERAVEGIMNLLFLGCIDIVED